MQAFHLTPTATWADAPPDAAFAPASLASDGFVHLTFDEDELLAVGDRLYRADPRPYVALVVDLERLSAPWRTDGDPRFPHVYGPLEREAIVGVRAVTRAADGTFERLA